MTASITLVVTEPWCLCVFCLRVSPGLQQLRQPHVHLRGDKQPSEPHGKHQALQQKGTNVCLDVMELKTSAEDHLLCEDVQQSLVK